MSFDTDSDAGVKARLVNLISAVRVLLRSTYDGSPRFLTLVPLIVINILVIIYELILG